MVMGAKKTPKLISALRETLQKVEQTSGVEPDDPALVELKSILIRRVADLERALAQGRTTPLDCSPADDYITRQEPESARFS
jgi:hypothetical protein